MKKKITRADEPIGDIQVLPDFLPPPAELAFREEGVKVTLALSKKSVEFFKLEASKHQTQYQRMIRRLLDAYVEAQGEVTETGESRRASRQRAVI
jgi:predicted DNA binding CopG/RHH family protein